MITNALINFAYYVANFFINLFPVGSGFPVSVHNATSSLGGYLRIIDPLLPVSTLATIVVLVVAFELALFAFRTFRWLLTYLPFVGGK